MKVIQITGSDVGGGAEVVVSEHHRELQRQGHTVQRLVGRKRSEDAETDEIPFVRGPKGVLRTARWLQRSTGLQNLYAPGFRAIESVFRFVPDILHFHSLHGVESFAELSVVRRLAQKYPCVISLHDLWLMTGHCGHPMGCEKWKTGCGRCPDLTIYPSISRDATRWNFRRKRSVFRKTDAQLIVPSTWLKEQVEQSPIVRHLKTSVVPNPVDLKAFCPNDAAAERSRFDIEADERLVMVAQDLENPFKGIDLGIETLNRMEIPRLRVLLVGHHGEKIASRLTLPSTCLPFTSNKKELAAYYGMADVLLMPSRGETFGLVAAEAMASGTPVVAFRTGGLVDVIGQDGAGVLVKQDDPAEMAEQLACLLKDRAARSQMSKLAVERVRELFSLSDHTRRTTEIYEHAIESKAC